MSVLDLAGSSRPRLPASLPVLRRDDRRIQIGVEPGPGLLLDGVPSTLDPVLDRLDGEHPLDALRVEAGLRGSTVAVFDQVLASLDDAGLLIWNPVDAAPDGGEPVRLVGAGRTGRAVAEHLLAAGIAPLQLCDGSPVDLDLYPGAPLAGCLADALADHLGSSGRSWGSGGSGDETPGLPADALTVVAVDTWEVDRRVTDGLLREDRPHLLVRPWAGGIAVGPLVVPGRSACLNCVDTGRTARDPHWPRLLPQLVRRPGGCPDDLLALGAGLVVSQVCGWRTDRRAELIGATALVVPPDRHLRTQRCEPHPDCGCAWPVTAR